MAKIPLAAEKVFTVGFLLLSTSALTLIYSRTVNTNESASSSNPLLLSLWIGSYSFTLFLLYALRKRTVQLVTKDILVWAIVGIALLSCLWSTVPSLTFRRSILLIGTNAFSLYLATRYSLEEQLRLLAWTLGIGAILSLVFAIALPVYGIDMTGAWRGIYPQKNTLARLMVLGTIVFLLLALSIRKYRWFAWAILSLSIGLTLLSQSKTALVNLVTLLLLVILYRALRLHYTRAIPLLIFIVLIVGSAVDWFWTNSTVILSSLGKDVTLTGRTQVWEAVFQMILKRPILGYGFKGFWVDSMDSPANYVWAAAGWHPNHAHNGILNLWLELGLLGLTVFALGYLMLVIRSVSWLRSTKTAIGFWPLLYITYIFLYNQTESSLISENSFFWIIYATLSFSLPIQKNQFRKITQLSTQK